MDETQAKQDPFESLLAEFMLRIDRGEEVDREQFIAAHPDEAGRLWEYFANADAVEAMVPPSKQPRTAAGGGGGHPGRIGRYRIERVLGQGGFGLVYLAHDDQLERLVAIKVPHRHRVSSSEDAEAYLTEARTVANLDHPHIVPVFDVGSTGQFPCYVVSKYIDGTDLGTRLKQSRLSQYEAAELVATVAVALQHAHKQGLVHRDIKPGNILLDKNCKPFVADFGLALREQDVGKGSRYAGTPAYMSPEQARGEGHRVDGRSDIFSLGVVLYELLAGRQPFHADSQTELLEQVANFEPRPLRQVDEGIPKELERICFKALAKRASERYMTANDLADDLRHFLAQKSAPPDASINLLHQLWKDLDPDLQDALALAYNQAKREGKQRISTRTFFAAVARLRPGRVSPMLDLLPKGSLPEPIEEGVPSSPETRDEQSASFSRTIKGFAPVSELRTQILEERPLLSDCIENAFNHLGKHVTLGCKLATEDVFVDVAKFGTGPSVTRLRAYGVTPQTMDRIVAQLGWKVIQRR